MLVMSSSTFIKDNVRTLFLHKLQLFFSAYFFFFSFFARLLIDNDFETHLHLLSGHLSLCSFYSFVSVSRFLFLIVVFTTVYFVFVIC